MEQLILIVEDDPVISEIIDYNLAKAGFRTLCAADGETGLEYASTRNPDLILLDIMLPGMNGFEVCRKVREFSTVPILMLTARESEDDRVEGLELGADDYIIKPFRNRELVSRVRANLRRTEMLQAPAVAQSAVAKGLSFDTQRQEVKLDGKRLDLSVREYEILHFLYRAKGRVFTREEILSQVYGYSYAGVTRTVDVAIRRLREKMEEAKPGGGRYIGTRHGLGYFYSDDTDQL